MSESSPSRWHELLRVLSWLRPHWRVQVGLLGLMALGTGLSLAYPWLLKLVFDQVFARDRYELLPWLAAGIAASAVAGAALSALASWHQARLAVTVLLELRTALFDRLQRLSLDYVQRARLGDLLSRLGGDLNEVQTVATSTVIPLAGALLNLTGSVVLLAWISPTLLGVALLFAPAAWALVRLFRPRVEARALQVRERNADLGSQMVESLQEARFVRASGTADLEVSRFAALNRALATSVLGFQKLSLAYGGTGQVLVAINGLAILLVGAALVRQEMLTVGDLVAFALYQARLFGPVRGLTAMALGLHRARASVRRVFEVLDEDLPAAPSGGGKALDALEGRVELQHVGFAYDPGHPVLEGVSFIVPPGRSLAVVGPSGVGKSTLVDLLLGLRQPTAGTVKIDGHPLETLDPGSFLPRMALVSQRPAVWSDTWRANLLYGIEPRDDREVWEALQQVGLLSFVERQGLDAHVGQRGARLSEGQRQRLGLARALLRRPAVLVLDEVTAGLDWEADRLVGDLLASLDGRVTRILVTHRLSLSAIADEVVVLQEGQVVQRGDHAALKAAPGLYRDLLRRQVDVG